jgi:transcriptional regulator with XRE-family HTH domain
MNYLQKLGIQITRRREQLGLNQTDIAELTKISDKTVRAIEKGRDTVAIKNWIAVADAVGLEFNLLVKKMNDETRKSIE